MGDSQKAQEKVPCVIKAISVIAIKDLLVLWPLDIVFYPLPASSIQIGMVPEVVRCKLGRFLVFIFVGITRP